MLPAVAVSNVVGFAMWMLLIKQVPLGIALPLMGANFVTVALAGKFFFGERLNAQSLVGNRAGVGGLRDGRGEPGMSEQTEEGRAVQRFAAEPRVYRHNCVFDIAVQVGRLARDC